MQKILSLVLGILICCVMGTAELCIGYCVMYVLTTQSINKSSWWEIPLASLFISVIVQLFPDSLTEMLRVLIISASVITAYFYPRRLILLVPMTIVAIVLKNEYAIGAMWAAIWQCGYAFGERKKEMQRKKSANANLC